VLTNVKRFAYLRQKSCWFWCFVAPFKNAKCPFGLEEGRQWRNCRFPIKTTTDRNNDGARFYERGGVVGGLFCWRKPFKVAPGAWATRETIKLWWGVHIRLKLPKECLAIGIKQCIFWQRIDTSICWRFLRTAPRLLGIGIGNNGIVVKGNEFEVIWKKTDVLVYDGNFYSKEGFSLKKLPEKSVLYKSEIPTSFVA